MPNQLVTFISWIPIRPAESPVKHLGTLQDKTRKRAARWPQVPAQSEAGVSSPHAHRYPGSTKTGLDSCQHRTVEMTSPLLAIICGQPKFRSMASQ